MSFPSVILAALSEEFQNIRDYDVSWRNRIWCYRNGFLSDKKIIYGLDRSNVSNYFSDVSQVKSNKSIYNNTDTKLTSDKYVFHMSVGEEFPSYVPEIYALYKPGYGVVGIPRRKIESFSDLLELLEQKGSVVIKRKSGGGGRDVHILEHRDGMYFTDGENASSDRIRSTLEEMPESIVTEYIRQADYAANIYSRGANTIRILTLIDPETRSPFIGAAVHRFGAEGSMIDNWSSGGIVADLDVESGKLGNAASSPKKGGVFAKIDYHPDTNTQIKGTKVPGWDLVKEKILEISGEYSDLTPYLAWDVIITDDDGSFKIVESQATSNVDLIQVHQPLLVDERVRRFYQHYGLL